ncbi:MAG: hypothetical protein QOE90_2866 [Thermoplasmata archaeon]|jgi:hypothetical protein|nr:hypothetical protein [Thermoplasmata archaeon]
MRWRKASPPLFVAGIGMMGWGIGDDITPLWIAGIAVFVIGLALIAKRKRN